MTAQGDEPRGRGRPRRAPTAGETPDNETRQRMLDAAEELFMARGYAAVRLRDIASAVGLRHASLYYYAPGGKEQLYIEVMERGFERHRAGLTAAIAGAGDDFRAQMRAVARWLVLEPLDLARMSQSDMLAIDEERAHSLMLTAFNALREPIAAALRVARSRGLIPLDDFDTAAMALVGLTQSVHGIPAPHREETRLRLADRVADMLLDGWLTR